MRRGVSVATMARPAAATAPRTAAPPVAAVAADPVQIQPIVNAVQSALASQGSLAGGDPAVEEAIDHLTSALGPAIRQAAMDLAEQAAIEVRAQLPDRNVDLILSDGDPSLRIAEPAVASEPITSEDLDARITLRVPPSLKALVEDAAETAGGSVNSWILDALSRRARKPQQNVGFRTTHSFDL